MTLLQAQGLAFVFPGGVSALSGVDLAVSKGSRIGILGPNGAGKSTLLLHLNGTLRPTSGRVLLDDKPVDYGRSGLTEWRRRVGLVLQEPDDQLFAASVFEDVSFGPLNLGLGEAETKERVHEALAALLITDLADRPTHMLSGGQKKRVAIAGAVAMRPDVLLLDEPTAGLDSQSSSHLVALLKGLAASGTALVFATHDVDLAYDMADEVAIFDGGRLAASGRSEDILGDRESLARVHLRPPLLLQVATKARALGWLAPDEPLPKDPQHILDMMERWRPH